MTEAHARTLTPLRESAHEQQDGCWLLSSPKIDYLDGGEERILEIVRGAEDLSSLSDELEAAAKNWPELYSLSRGRANVLRPLALNREHTVLEVGAGCGPITRYLGEVCGTVDAVEPMPARARVISERTRDLDNVEVYIGGVEDVPAQPAYDVIVVIGVLEYAGGGSGEEKPYVEFLTRLRAALKPGGRIVCAIENRLGVKYLAGAPEDHVNRAFEGLEDYPHGGHAHTFSRSELSSLFAAAGLEPSFLHLFPDYKLTRAVLTERLLASPDLQQLGWLIPWFPSPDWLDARPHLADERALWRSLAEDGIGQHFSNSFLVIAGDGDAVPLYSADQLASFYNTQRRALFATETCITDTGHTRTIQRSRLLGPDKSVTNNGITLRLTYEELVSGRDFIEVLARSDDEGLAAWLDKWAELVHSSGDEHNIDLTPHNFIVTEQDTLIEIDQEWSAESYGKGDIIERGIFWLAIQLADRTVPERWAGECVRDVTTTLGGMIGLDADGTWIDSRVAAEAVIQAQVLGTDPGTEGWNELVEIYRERLMGEMDKKLTDTTYGDREHQHRAAAERARDEALAEQARTKDEITKLKRELHTKQGELDSANRRISEIEGSIGWRALNRARPIVRKVAPRGSPQFKALKAAARTGISAARVARKPFARGPGAPAEHATAGNKPRVRRLRAGCYGEHCWTVGGGTVHALQLLLPLLPYFEVELLLPPGVPLRDRKWYIENMQIDIGNMKVAHYTPGAEDTYDVWLSVWNQKLWPAKTPKLFNLLFFPFVELDGEGFTHIVNSEYTADYGRERYHSDDMVVIPPYVNVDEYKTGPKEGMILHCSRFALPSAYADKAHVMMIQAFKQLVDRGLQGWKLVLAGATIDEGEEVYKNHLQKHAYGYPIEFKTNLPADDLRDLFARASVYWHATGYSVKEPAAQEHFGITIIEGMASGAVPVVYNSGGPPEIITNGENGYLFDTLEQMVDETWNLATDPERWREMSKAARERAGFFSAEMVKERMLRTVCGTEKVSIIIGSHNNREVLTRAIESVLKYTPPGFELIVVDQACTDGTGVYLASLDYPNLKIIRNTENKSFAAFNNQGLEIATRPYILYLNDDVEAFPGWIEPLIDTLDRYPKVGGVGSRLLYPDGRVQHDGKMFKKDDLSPYHLNMGGKVPADESPVEVDALTAACLMVRKELAGFSEDYIRGYYEDTDLCLRIKEKGYALVLHRGSVLIHYHGMSFGKNQAASEEAQAINRKTFLDRWGAKIPDLVYLASEAEMKGTDIRCQPIMTPEERAVAWPISKRLVR